MPHLRVDDGRHPEALAGPGHRQHGPEEDEDGQHQRGHGCRDHVVEDDDQVTHHLRVSHQHVIESVAELEDLRLTAVETLRRLQLLVIEHPDGEEQHMASAYKTDTSWYDALLKPTFIYFNYYFHFISFLFICHFYLHKNSILIVI